MKVMLAKEALPDTAGVGEVCYGEPFRCPNGTDIYIPVKTPHTFVPTKRGHIPCVFLNTGCIYEYEATKQVVLVKAHIQLIGDFSCPTR